MSTVPPAMAGARRQETQADDAAGLTGHAHDKRSVASCSPELSDTRSMSDPSMFRAPSLGPESESVKRPLGLHWKLVGNMENQLVTVVAKPHDRSAGAPELGSGGIDRSRNASVGDTDVEFELTAVVRTGRVEKLPDGQPETCGPTEKFVDGYVPAASLYCARSIAPNRGRDGSCGRRALPESCAEAHGTPGCSLPMRRTGGLAPWLDGRSGTRTVRGSLGPDRFRQQRLDGHSPSICSRPLPGDSVHSID